jgi:hypothetical protein
MRTHTLPTFTNQQMLNRCLVLLGATTTLAAPSAAPLDAQQAPAVRLIAAPTTASKQTLGIIAAIRELPGGRVLVNDVAKRQLLMYDPALGTATIVADSTPGTPSSYGPSAGAIIAYLADSSLFVDPRDLTMFVIDPNGTIARVAAVPRSQDAGSLGSNTLGAPALDSKGRLVYRVAAAFRMPSLSPRGSPPAAPEIPDSAAIVRVDLATRRLDTAGFFKTPKTKLVVTQSERGVSMTTELNPMPTVDDWAVLADGSIAVVRGQDYHVDLLSPDGARSSSPKLPFDWQRLTDDDKIAVIDSAKTAMERVRTAAATGAPSPDGGPLRVMTNITIGGDGPARSATTSAAAPPPMNFVLPSELPDYRPAFTQGAAKADLDGNLWIRTTSVRASAIAGPIYDVVDAKGQLVDRVQVPSGRTIVGFGKGGVVYMMARDDKGAWLERTHK